MAGAVQLVRYLEGRAVAFGALADTRGFFGRATQSLVLDRR